jgi:xanthine/uracil permease
MDYVTPVTVGGTAAIIFGMVLVLSGLHARRGRRLHQRQGAEVLAAVIMAFGLGVIAAGVLYLLRGV